MTVKTIHNQQPDPIRVMTKKETATYLRLTIANLEKLVAKGHLRPIRYPGVRRYFFDRKEVDHFIYVCQVNARQQIIPPSEDRFGYRAIAHGSPATSRDLRKKP